MAEQAERDAMTERNHNPMLPEVQTATYATGAPARSADPTHPVVEPVPLSQSSIWQRQRDFYVQRGAGVWTGDKVPQFITNNPFIAEIYADIVFGFIRDCAGRDAAKGQRQPVRIVELGAGTGKFAYLFLKHLTALLNRDEPLRYYMTDCSPELIESWRSNPYLAEFAQLGLLSFARFEAEHEPPLLPALADSPPGPLVVIANYVFDSLPADVFSFREGVIEELLLTAAVPAKATHDAAPLSKLDLSFHPVPITRGRYPDPIWNAILEEYRNRFRSATVLFPVSTLNLLSRLTGLSDGRMLILAADKGHPYEDTIAAAQGQAIFEWHAQECFSLMVNFDAIARFFRATGGQALLPDKHSSRLHICGFLRAPDVEQFPQLRSAYREAQSGFGPDDLFALLAWLNAHMEEIRIPQILATLRLSRWDPIALMRLFPVLGPQLRNAEAERQDIHNAVVRIWANHYPVAADENVLAFDCGVILLELRFFEEAMEMFRISQRVLGPSATTSYNLGLCANGLGQPEDALTFMKEARALDPAFDPGDHARKKLEAERGKGR